MIGEGRAVTVWSAPTDSGFAFDAIGENRRVPVDVDGLTLVRFKPQLPDGEATSNQVNVVV